MKTMKRGDEVTRVNDIMAELYQQQGWKFCPKSEWKAVRDAPNKS